MLTASLVALALICGVHATYGGFDCATGSAQLSLHVQRCQELEPVVLACFDRLYMRVGALAQQQPVTAGGCHVKAWAANTAGKHHRCKALRIRLNVSDVGTSFGNVTLTQRDSAPAQLEWHRAVELMILSFNSCQLVYKVSAQTQAPPDPDAPQRWLLWQILVPGLALPVAILSLAAAISHLTHSGGLDSAPTDEWGGGSGGGAADAALAALLDAVDGAPVQRKRSAGAAGSGGRPERKRRSLRASRPVFVGSPEDGEGPASAHISMYRRGVIAAGHRCVAQLFAFGPSSAPPRLAPLPEEAPDASQAIRLIIPAVATLAGPTQQQQ